MTDLNLTAGAKIKQWREPLRPWRIKDLTGQRFKMLMVESFVGLDPGAKWKCLCDCGNYTEALATNLKRGITKSCGCLKLSPQPNRRKDLTGQRSGLLVAISSVPREKGRMTWWNCRCDCGNEKTVRIDHFRTQAIASCGCAANLGPFKSFRPEQVREVAAAKDHVRRARKGNSEGWFTAEEISALFVRQKRRCANCRCRITKKTMHKDHIVSLSRGGSNSISNIQLLCQPCNRKKYNKDPIIFAREQGRLM